MKIAVFDRVFRLCAFCLVGLGVSVAVWAQLPASWFVSGNAPQEFSFSRDESVHFEGKSSARITSKDSPSPGSFGTLMQAMSAENYLGGRVRLTGYLKTEQAANARMWMRVDGPDEMMMTFDNMEFRPITGTTDWKRYEIVLDVPEDAKAVAYGFLIMGKGTVWADAFKIEKLAAPRP